MKKAILITTINKYNVIKCIEGSGDQYWPHSSEVSRNIKLRPATENDIIAAFIDLGVDYYKVNPILKEKIIEELNGIDSTHIATGQGKYNDKFYYQWYYEFI